MRGVILGPKIDGLGRISGNDSIGSAIKRSILYYDKIDVPSSNVLFLEPSPVMAELAAAGVLQRTHVTYRAGMIAAPGPLFQVVQFSAFEHLETQAAGVWHVAQEGDTLSLPAGVFTEGRSLQVTLTKLLPVPAEDVPVAEILAFKTKRSDELRAFDAAMEGLYQLITNSNDSERAYEAAKETIRIAVADMFKALNESMATQLLTFARIGVRVGEAVSAAALGNHLAAASAGVQIATMATGTPSSVKRLGPFAFVHSVIDELV